MFAPSAHYQRVLAGCAARRASAGLAVANPNERNATAGPPVLACLCVYARRQARREPPQSPKRLYLTVFPPDMPEEEDNGENLPILNGYAVGEIACKLYPSVMVEYDQGLSKAIKETTRLVADEHVQCIHEATFSFDNILVRVDC